MIDPTDQKVSYLELELEKIRLKREKESLQPLSGALKKLVDKFAPTHNKDAVDGIQGVRKIWAQVVGQGISKHTLPVRWKEGKLTVNVDSAPLATELKTFAERSIMKNLQEEGLDGIHSIHFQNGPSDLNSDLNN
ncbi:MAG: hypothetical protein CBC13_08425 [Planctomycetia bacterium TMED53]|nr:MAG: hypothetical protein CBC13_08425 [Planctomycetia bacterium TMED53]